MTLYYVGMCFCLPVPQKGRYIYYLSGSSKNILFGVWTPTTRVYIIQIYNLVGIALKYQIILQGAAASIHSNTCPLQNLGGFYLKKSSSKTLQLPNL